MPAGETMFRALAVAALAALAACVGGCGESDSDDAGVDASATPVDGELSVLTYNVAALPQGLSQSEPERNLPLISPLLNTYDLVLVQEDFVYHDLLSAAAEHPHRSETSGLGDCSTVCDQPESSASLGDGLNRFSRFAFAPLWRRAWERCNGLLDAGSDCLTPKGVSVAHTQLATGAVVDVYNLHMDASGGDADVRAEQVTQLLSLIEERSSGRAIILGGDTNMRRDEPGLQALLDGAGLRDACREVDCGDERIDRVMLRDGDGVELTVRGWRVADEFKHDEGGRLSDHRAVHVDIAFSADGAGMLDPEADPSPAPEPEPVDIPSDERCPSEEVFRFRAAGCCVANTCGVADPLITGTCLPREAFPSQYAELDALACDR